MVDEEPEHSRAEPLILFREEKEFVPGQIDPLARCQYLGNGAAQKKKPQHVSVQFLGFFLWDAFLFHQSIDQRLESVSHHSI